MARPLRIAFAGALYQVTSRGDRREAIFEDDEDRDRFLGVLAEVVERYNWVCQSIGTRICLIRLSVRDPADSCAPWRSGSGACAYRSSSS